MQIGGMELSPYGYGVMETQPHAPLDSANLDFANFYSRIDLWIAGTTANGDTFVITPVLTGGSAAGFTPREMFYDTTNVLGYPNAQFTAISIFEDSLAGWRIEQFNVAVNDHSSGILVYHLHYDGQLGDLSEVFAGVRFDFDAPDADNHPTSDDDILEILSDGYRARDEQSAVGVEVRGAFSPQIFNYWERSQLPQNAVELYDGVKATNPVVPQGAQDYHFYLGSGPFGVQSGESIVLIYHLQPFAQGLGKSAEPALARLQIGSKQFQQDKRLASVAKSAVPGLSRNGSVVPAAFRLRQNYPNPFNPETRIRFDLPANASTGDVTLEIFNAAGQKVRTLLNRSLESGSYTALWDGRDDHGNTVSSGVYIYRLSTPGFRAQKKMLLVR